MKTRYALFILCLIALGVNLSAQINGGADKIVINSPGKNQTYADISVAFNGWTYVAVKVANGTDLGYVLKRSKDNGATWSTIDSITPTGAAYPAIDIEVAGTDTNNLTLFLVGVYNDVVNGSYTLYVDKYNATTGSFISPAYNSNFGTRQIYSVAIASDWQFPAINSTPYSVGIAYSCYSSTLDSINYIRSLDGGATFTLGANVATTGSYFRNVSIAYGRSSSASNGRYFLAWEQVSGTTARTGHIYTSRNTTSVDGGFITPVNLDSISSTCINLCSHPSIAVQYNNTDNDSAACTAIVTFDRDYNGDGSDYDLLAFYNKRAHFTNFWYRSDINNTGQSCKNPHTIFDTQTSNFYTTYADSTNSLVTYVTNTMNDPTNFTVGLAQYNDAPLSWGTKQIAPKIAKGITKASPEFVWVNNAGNVGTAYYENVLNTGVGVNEVSAQNMFKVFPNPTTGMVYITNHDNADAIETIKVYTISGQLINQINAEGAFNNNFDISNLQPGIYMVEVTLTNGNHGVSRIVKM